MLNEVLIPVCPPIKVTFRTLRANVVQHCAWTLLLQLHNVLVLVHHCCKMLYLRLLGLFIGMKSVNLSKRYFTKYAVIQSEAVIMVSYHKKEFNSLLARQPGSLGNLKTLCCTQRKINSES